MFSKIILTALPFLTFVSAYASFEEASRLYSRGSISYGGHQRVIIELVEDKFYFAAVPWAKDALVMSKGSVDSQFDAALDRILERTGVKPFETLPEEVLRKSKASQIRYIIGKKLFKRGEAGQALSELERVNSEDSAFPFVANLKAVIHSSLGNHDKAGANFKDCVRYSDRMIGDAETEIQKNQFAMNKDYCMAGIARAEFAMKNYTKAESAYLDIQKEAFVWPEILFEEAWTSYYKRNYNRTLGKLISYRAPVFNFVFNPEIEVLKGLTYLKMCLYDDAKRTVDDFYQEYESSSKNLRTLLNNRGKDYRYYYTLLADFDGKKPSPLPILDSILSSVNKDSAMIEMKNGLNQALREYNSIRKLRDSSLRTNLIKNLKTLLDEYRILIGAYVRAGVVSKYMDLYTAFQGMSYIKLEVLAQRKERLYESDEITGKKRGDVKYIDRNDKQYFWNFNGEFWADELGDYVFALRSEC